MKDTSKTSLRRGHNEGNIRQRTDGRWEVRLSAGIDYKTGKPKRTSTCCNTRQEAITILQQQAHEVRTQGWRDPMSVTLGEWYEYWLDTYMKDTVKQSTYASYRSYLNKHFCVLGKILLKKLEPHTLQEFYNYKFREEGLSPKTLRNYHMALHKCLQQAVKERLLVYNPCDAVTLPSGEKPEISVFTNDQQRALVQASYRHRYGVFIRLDLCTGLRMGELLALKWEDIDFSTAQLHVRRTINRLAKYEAHDGENKTEIVFGTPKTKNSRRTIPLTRTMVDELTRWKQQQAQDKIRAGDKYTDYGFIVTNEFGHYFEQKTFKDYYDRMLKDADIGHFTFHALRHTFATRALERGMDYKTLSAILGHYSVAFTMDTYVHSMDEHKRHNCEQQIHENARKQNDAALPKRLRTIGLRTFGQVELVRVVERTGRPLGQVDSFALILESARAEYVVLVGFLRTNKAAPFLKHIERLNRLVEGDAHLLGDIVGVHRAVGIGECERVFEMRVFGARLHAAHFRVAAKGNRRDAELRAPFLEADVGARHAQHELGDAHAEGARRQIVAAFVDDNQDAQHDGAVQDHEDDVQQRAPCLSCGHTTKRDFT